MIWSEFLEPYSVGENTLFDTAFMERLGGQDWNPTEDDKSAAAKLHVQMVSRIATQRLAYVDGVEKTALKSVYDLFEHTRNICTAHCLASHFTVLVWHVLNTHVRPFTAKWHPRSERGMLAALDTTDEFRTELEIVQQRLRRFNDLLTHLRDGTQFPTGNELGEDTRLTAIKEEMAKSVPWGIPSRRGGIDPTSATTINHAEKAAIEARRAHYNLDPKKPEAVALALSGGGIRSATFSLGVLVALARRGLLPQFDYLSTVSGGGYLGSFLTTFLNTPADRQTTPSIGLRSGELPFERTAGEAEALRHIRHHSKYLASGSIFGHLQMIGAQLYGMVINALGVVLLAAMIAQFEYFLRGSSQGWSDHVWSLTFYTCAAALTLWTVVSLILIRFGRAQQRIADGGIVVLGLVLLGLLAWRGLGYLHYWIATDHEWPLISKNALLIIFGAIPAIASAFAAVAGKAFDRVKFVLGALAAISAPVFFFGVYLAIYQWAETSTNAFAIGSIAFTWLHLFVGILAVVYFWLININFTSPHRHYRQKLTEAYLIRPIHLEKSAQRFEQAVEMKLSTADSVRAPYHLINAALNVPGSNDLRMQGRLTDFFLFSRKFCGSPLTGYRPTIEWEEKDKHLDLGTAMAISGAAAAPQMGLGTKKRLSFWLALLNVRLGYWVRNPVRSAKRYGGSPGLSFLLKEMLGSMSERSPWLYLSDGGHIENLGVYELLRRRCKYIVAVDGEQDERMTFAALTTLQRLAAIDLGVKIDIDLDDLRLNEQGLSRSHFRFCRIEYPGKEYGYLLYVKLSLTGNEGEFLRRYRLDEPAFPHHSTADQFFTEAQFEAYRSLGEHIGDKLFLRALVGEELAKSNAVKIEDLFRELGTRLLNPLP